MLGCINILKAKNMIANDLNIVDKGNQFVITIDKKQLNTEYILNLFNWLQFTTYKPIELNIYLTQIHQITKNKSVHKDTNKRNWNYSGSVNLNSQLDNVNLRDFAYE